MLANALLFQTILTRAINMLKDASILITGGTGSFGKSFLDFLSSMGKNPPDETNKKSLGICEPNGSCIK
mgnify:CR=1 FL=1